MRIVFRPCLGETRQAPSAQPRSRESSHEAADRGAHGDGFSVRGWPCPCPCFLRLGRRPGAGHPVLGAASGRLAGPSRDAAARPIAPPGPARLLSARSGSAPPARLLPLLGSAASARPTEDHTEPLGFWGRSALAPGKEREVEAGPARRSGCSKRWASVPWFAKHLGVGGKRGADLQATPRS